MSDVHSCYDKAMFEAQPLSSWSSASSWVELCEQSSQNAAELSSDAHLDTSSLGSDFDAGVSLNADQVKCLEHALHCEEETELQSMTSPQNSDASALSHQDPFMITPWNTSRKHLLAAPAAYVLAPQSPCLAEVPTESIHETVNVAVEGRAGYIDPDADSTIFRIAETYGFTHLMIVLGTTYFRRLAHSNFFMLQVAAASPEFGAFVMTPEQLPVAKKPCQPLVGSVHANFLNDEAWLILIHLTCIYLAAKVLEYVPCKNMLQTIMSHIYDYSVATQWVELLESEILSALEWQLGPVYSTRPRA